MPFNVRKFLIFCVSLLCVAVISILAFPLERETGKQVFDYDTKMNVPLKEIDNTALIIIAAAVIVLGAWLLWPEDEAIPKIRTSGEILYDPNSSQTLSKASITLPCEIDIDRLQRQYSIGHLRAFRAYNHHRTPVYMVAIAEDNYSTTTTRPRSTCPVISWGYTPMAWLQAQDWLKFSERSSFVQRMKSVMGELKGQDEGIRKYMLEQAEKKEDDSDANED